MALVPVSDGPLPPFPCSEEVFLDHIKQRGSPDAVDQYGRTALCNAIKRFRSARLVESLLELGANPNATSCIRSKILFLAKDPRAKRFALRGTALHAAVYVGKIDIIEILLAKGADVDPRTSKGLTPLQLALESDVHREEDREPLSKDENLKLVTALLESGTDVGITYPHTGDTLLHQATRVGNEKIVCFLLSTGHKWDINAPDKRGQTALHIACDDPCLTELLLQHGADPNSVCPSGITPYQDASRKEHTEVMEILYKHGANPNAADYSGFTALHSLAMSRHPNEKVLQLLLKHNADPCASDNLNRTPHYYVRSLDMNPAERFLCLLAGAGGDLNRRDAFGIPLLHSIVQRLLKTPDIYQKKEDSKEMLKNVVDTYVKAGVDINVRDLQNRTVLHLAAADGVIPFVETLLEFGADVNARDCDGNTPLHIAAKHGDTEVIKVYLKTTKNVRRDIPNEKMETFDEIFAMQIRELRSFLDKGKTMRFTRVTYHSATEMRNLEDDIVLLMDVMKTVCKKREKNTKRFPLESRLEEPSGTGNIEEYPSQPIGASIHWNVANLRSMPKELRKDEIFFDFLCRKERKIRIEVGEDDNITYNRGVAIRPIQDRLANCSNCLPEYCQQYSIGKFHLDETCQDEKCKIARQVRALVEDLVASCAEMDPRFSCKLFLTGSTAEGTKMWAPDEFDFMMELSNLEGHCDMDTIHYSAETFVVLREDIRPMWHEFLNDSGRFVPKQLRNYVAVLLWKASLSLQKQKFPNLRFNLGQYHNNACPGCFSDQPLVKYSKVGACLHLQWVGDQYKELDIDVDITPAIKFQRWAGDDSLPTSLNDLKECGCHVIPLGLHADIDLQWRVSFSVAELRLILQLSEQQLSIYKAVKLLQDINIMEGEIPSYLLKTMVFNYVFKENADCPNYQDLTYHVCRLLYNVGPRGPVKHFFMDACVTVDILSFAHWLKSALTLLGRDGE